MWIYDRGKYQMKTTAEKLHIEESNLEPFFYEAYGVTTVPPCHPHLEETLKLVYVCDTLINSSDCKAKGRFSIFPIVFIDEI